ncbi:MAG: hypothetical protein IPK44_01000 [Candidatus Accumulibacter sp.]|uniref:hypothetical protein n=1 Tax=Accumulibacter sp. TaxID=2053492 RepID=UPI0025887680|nr:hypothetical protein [Accumulibacter sp.]MBK8113175.1 hypothetical protein [Accumulibacter sp.]
MAIDTSWANVSLLCPFDTDLLDIKGHAIKGQRRSALSSGCRHAVPRGQCAIPGRQYSPRRTFHLPT